jgi:PKHD-type hydroxylase
MIVQIAGILRRDAADSLRQTLVAEAQTFKPGTATAGWHARDVKKNEQASGPAAARVIATVGEALNAHPVFKAVARPKALVGLLVSRYGPGMEYGSHVDNAMMNGIRTDLSFTVFLAPPESYEGGELIIEGNDGEQAVKLDAGSAVVYPSTSLHRVSKVIGGERLVVVGWVRSMIRRGDQREILFDIDQTIATLRETAGERAVMDRLMKTKANLLRMWAED